MEKILPIEYSGTILSDEVNNRLNKYGEPIRSGIKRGEKIGFSRIKYMAALLLGATCFNQKEIAELLGVSYSSLRQWNMTADFRASRMSVRLHFVMKLAEYFKHDVTRKPNKRISDAEIYNDDIFLHLIDMLFQLKKKDKDYIFSMPDILMQAFNVNFFEEKRALQVEKTILEGYLQSAKKYNFVNKKIFDYMERYQYLIL